MKVLFFGTSAHSVVFLETLVTVPGIRVLGVVSPVTGRRKERTALKRLRWAAGDSLMALSARTPWGEKSSNVRQQLQTLATQAGVPIWWPPDVNDPAFVAQLARLGADLIVMGSFCQILKAPLLEKLPPVLNIHPTLLPNYRGPMPPFWIIANGERESGVTLHWVDGGVDTGPVLAREKFIVEPWLTGGEYADRADEVGARLLARVLQGLRPGDVGRGDKQQGEGSYQGAVKPADLVVPCDAPWKVAYDRARAAAPFRRLTLHVPATLWLGETWRGQASTAGGPNLMEVELSDAVPVAEHQPMPARWVERTPERGLYVQCQGGGVLFRKVTSAGRALVQTSQTSPAPEPKQKRAA